MQREIIGRVGPAGVTRNKSNRAVNLPQHGIQRRRALVEANNVLGAHPNVQKESGINEVKKPARGKMLKRNQCPKPSETTREKPAEENKENSENDIDALADDILTIHIIPDNVPDIDCEDSNPQFVTEYVKDIYRYMWSLEKKYAIRLNHLENQPEITGKMRGILVDWIVQVHLKFHLTHETLFLTVSILDRFLQVHSIHRSKLQLVGVAAMFIACKYEEICIPEVQDFVFITDNAYSKREILKMEILILSKLDFNLSKPLPLHFLRRNSRACTANPQLHALGKYLLEIMLPEYELSHYSPSLMAAAASYLSMVMFNCEEPWDETMVFYSNHTEKEVMPIVRKLCVILLRLETSKYQTTRTKYANAKLLKVSAIPELKYHLLKRILALEEAKK